MSPRAQGIAAAAGLIAVVTVLARAAGFVRTLVFADSVRAAGVGEVYNAVNAVPNVLYEVVAGGALAAIVVPIVAGHLGRDDRERADRTASVLLTWVLVLLVPVAVVVWVLATPIATWLVGPEVPDGVVAGATMLRIFAWQVPLYGIGAVLGGILQSHRRFGAVALAPLLSSLVVIATYAAYGSVVDGRTTGVGSNALALLAWGTTAGVAVLALPLLVPAHRLGWRWQPSLRFEGDDGRRARGLATAGLVALAGQQGATLTTIWIANHRGGGEGTLSVYTWIQAVYLLPYAVLAVPLATAAFPSLASRSTEGGATLARTLQALLALLGAGTAVLLGAAPQVGAFFVVLDARRGGGRVSGVAVDSLGDGLMAFALGLPAFGVAALLTRALYVHGRARAGGLAVGGGWAVSALGPLLTLGPGSTPHGILTALGLWWAGGMTCAAAAQWVLVRRAWGRGVLAPAWRTLLTAVVALVVGVGPVAALLRTHLDPGTSVVRAVGLAIVGAAAALIGYLACLAVGDRGSIRGLDPRRLRAGGAR